MAQPHEPTVTDLTTQGALPVGLSGRLVGIAPRPNSDGVAGEVHCVRLDAGRAVSYRSRPIVTDAVARRLGLDPRPGPRGTGPDIITDNIVAFGGSVLAFGEGSLAYELAPDLDTVRRVDLAGQARGLAPFPKRDTVTGDLHLLAVDAAGEQAHVVVSSRAFTRTSRPINGPGTPITDLAITRDHAVLAAEGFVGVAPLAGSAQPEWVATGVAAPRLVHAHEFGEAVVVHVLTPSLERWTLHASPATVAREVLDPTPRHSAQADDRGIDTAPRSLWTCDDRRVVHHDLVTAKRITRTFPRGWRPGDLVFVTDAARAAEPAGGWLVGFVHHHNGHDAELVVLDAADIERQPVATVRIPVGVPSGLRSTWVPDPPNNHNEGDRT